MNHRLFSPFNYKIKIRILICPCACPIEAVENEVGIFGFGVCWGVRFFLFWASGLWFSEKLQAVFRIWYPILFSFFLFGFWFLCDNDYEPLCSSWSTACAYQDYFQGNRSRSLLAQTLLVVIERNAWQTSTTPFSPHVPLGTNVSDWLEVWQLDCVLFRLFGFG